MRRFWLGLVAGALLLPLGTLTAAALGLMGTDTAPNPPLWEASLAHLAFTRSVERHADSLPNPVSPTEEELRIGLRIYSNICRGCHGFPNLPSSYGLAFYPRARQFADSPPDRPDWQNYWIMTNGIRRTAMAAWKHQLPEEKRWQVVTFLGSLKRLPPGVDSLWRHAGES
jgi:mono/diheme cytochrome c family protein